MHQASVNSLSFAPHELGFVLASASSDGSIGIISQVQGTYAEERVSQTSLQLEDFSLSETHRVAFSERA